jgi:hypothetical protein
MYLSLNIEQLFEVLLGTEEQPEIKITKINK